MNILTKRITSCQKVDRTLVQAVLDGLENADAKARLICSRDDSGQSLHEAALVPYTFNRQQSGTQDRFPPPVDLSGPRPLVEVRFAPLLSKPSRLVMPSLERWKTGRRPCVGDLDGGCAVAHDAWGHWGMGRRPRRLFSGGRRGEKIGHEIFKQKRSYWFDGRRRTVDPHRSCADPHSRFSLNRAHGEPTPGRLWSEQIEFGIGLPFAPTAPSNWAFGSAYVER